MTIQLPAATIIAGKLTASKYKINRYINEITTDMTTLTH